MRVTLDIGGSKTRGYVYDKEMQSFSIVGGFGLATDSDECLSALIEALEKQFDGGRYEVKAVAVNLGGKNKHQIKRTVEAAFPNAKVVVYRESEGDIAIKILQLYNADVLVMAGTGCIAFAKNGKDSIVLGGWGRDISDEGSGYYIGSLAIRLALKEMDGACGTNDLSPFTKRLFGVEKPFEYLSAFEYSGARDGIREKLPKTRDGIAALTRMVAECAEAGCALSKKVLAENGGAIGELIATAANRLHIAHPRVVINGGITNFKTLWEKELSNEYEVKYCNDAIDKALKTIVEEL